MESHDMLAHEDILHLTALREVLGGFAHEIAQPLNAIMIASQVIQLKLDRTSLSEEEKGFLRQRLSIVTSQVQKATEIIENLRDFSRGDRRGKTQTEVQEISRVVQGLMGQQFVGRGIELTWQCDDSPRTKCENARVLEGVLIQGLAFAREAVGTIASWHEKDGTPYKKRVHVCIDTEGGEPRIRIRWDAGKFPASHGLAHFQKHAGLSSARSVISALGGRMESSVSGLTVRFL